MARVAPWLLCAALLVLTGCAAHAPGVPDLPPAALQPAALQPAALQPVSNGEWAVVGVYGAVYGLAAVVLAASFVVDLCLLPASLANDDADLLFPCCRAVLDLAD